VAISLINFHNITMHICTKNNIISIIKCILSTSLLRVFVSIYNNYYSFSHASIHQRCLLLSTIYEALIEKQISCFFLKKTNYLFLSGHCMKLSTESLTLASLFSGGDGSVVLQRGQDRHLMSLFTVSGILLCYSQCCYDEHRHVKTKRDIVLGLSHPCLS
jgi:hypothetical protein